MMPTASSLPTYAALQPHSDNTCILLVLHEGECLPEKHTFTSAGFTEGGAGQWLRQHEPYAQVIPLVSLLGLVRYRIEQCTIAEVSKG